MIQPVFVIGSRAMQKYGLLPEKRKPKDWDIIGNKQDCWDFIHRIGKIEKEEITSKGSTFFLENGHIVEAEYWKDTDSHTYRLYNELLLSHIGMFWLHDSDLSKLPITYYYVPPEWQRFFKESHKYVKDSPHFIKTRIDLEILRKVTDLPVNQYGLLKEREDLQYRNGLPKLNVSKREFFNENEEFYVYDHDSIHEAVALGESPAYTFYMKDGEQVLTCKDKFFAVPDEIRLAGVYEETCVLALERSQIPNNFEVSPKTSFMMALEKVCTSITGGYFRQYAYDNYFKIIQLYKSMGEDDYIDRFHDNFYRIKPFKEK